MVEELNFEQYRKVCDEALRGQSICFTVPGDVMDIFIYAKDGRKYLVWAMDVENRFVAKRVEIPSEPADVKDILNELEEVKDDILYYLLANFPDYLEGR